VCVRAYVRASATLHAARKRVVGWSRFFFQVPLQQQLDSVVKANGRSQEANIKFGDVDLCYYPGLPPPSLRPV